MTVYILADPYDTRPAHHIYAIFNSEEELIEEARSMAEDSDEPFPIATLEDVEKYGLAYYIV